MPLLADAVLDGALAILDNANKAQVRATGSSILVNNITLNVGNFGAAGDNSGSGGGRKMQCLVSSASDMANIAVSAGGTPAKVALLLSSAIYAVASISGSPGALGSSDTVTLGTFSVILKDPT